MTLTICKCNHVSRNESTDKLFNWGFKSCYDPYDWITQHRVE